MEAFRASGLDYPDVTVATVASRGADQSAGDRALSYDFSGFRIEVSHRRPEIKVLPVDCQ